LMIVLEANYGKQNTIVFWLILSILQQVPIH
jgi:hypothetical protein